MPRPLQSGVRGPSSRLHDCTAHGRSPPLAHKHLAPQPWSSFSPHVPSIAGPGVDYLKYDNCFAKREDWVLDRYRAMGQALNATGRPILYSLCNWGVMEPWLWAPQVCARGGG